MCGQRSGELVVDGGDGEPGAVGQHDDRGQRGGDVAGIKPAGPWRVPPINNATGHFGERLRRGRRSGTRQPGRRRPVNELLGHVPDLSVATPGAQTEDYRSH